MLKVFFFLQCKKLSGRGLCSVCSPTAREGLSHGEEDVGQLAGTCSWLQGDLCVGSAHLERT